MRLVSGILVAAVGAAIGFSSPQAAAEVSFKGKQIRIVVPGDPGGGTDLTARFFAPFLQEMLPGNPTVIVENVPGGGSITGANYFQEKARPDGTWLFQSTASMHFPYLLGDRRVRYKMETWKALIGSPTGGVVFVRPELGVKSAADIAKLKQANLKFASQGPLSLDMLASMAFDLLGWNVQTTFGMTGRSAARLAFERKEVNVDYQTTSAYTQNVQPLVSEGRAVPLWSWGILDSSGNIARDPAFPDLPHFGEVYEIVHGKKGSGPAWDAYMAFFSAAFGVQKYLLLPAGVPDDVVAEMRSTAQKIVQNKGFKEKSASEMGDYTQSVGAEAQKHLVAMVGINPEAKAWVKTWLKSRFNVGD